MSRSGRLIMYQYLPALSWAATGTIMLIYFGSQLLALGNRSGLYHIAASPLVGAALFALRRRLQRPARRLDTATAEENAAEANTIAEVQDDTETVTSPSPELVSYIRRRKLILLALMMFTAPILSVIGMIWVESERMWKALWYIDAAVFSLCATMWCYFDCAEHGRRIKAGYRFLVFLIPIIGFPVYAIKTRGLRGLPLILSAAVFLGLSYALVESMAMIVDYFYPTV